MQEELLWGLPVIGYLFLAGFGAGALTVSASVFLRGGGGAFGGGHFEVARYGALLAPLPVIIGCLLLIFELGQPFRFLNLYKVMNLSPMSVGTWLLTFFIFVSIAYAFTFWRSDAGPDDRWSLVRRGIAWISVPLGIATAVYTGVLLGAMPSRPFWNTPILPMLFLLSSLSSGIGGMLFFRALFHRNSRLPRQQEEYENSGYLLTSSDVLLIGFEILAIFLFLMFGHLTVGHTAYAVDVLLPGGELAAAFWTWVVLIGLVIPALVELAFVVPRLLYGRPYRAPRAVEFVLPIAVLTGAFMLRYTVVVTGQVTGLTGL